MKKQPEVTAKTKARIMQAFWDLYKEKRIEKISVGMIMKSADLNRGTFYEYFIDIYDLLDQFEDQFIRDFTEKVNTYFEKETEEMLYFVEITRGFAKVFSEYEEEFYILMSRDSTFRSKVKEKLRERMLESIHLEETDKKIDYYLTFVISSLTALMEFWYDMKKNLSVEEIMELSQTLIFNGLIGSLKKYNEAAYTEWMETERKQFLITEDSACPDVLS